MALYTHKNPPPWSSGTLVNIVGTTQNSLYPYIKGCIGILQNYKDSPGAWAIWTLDCGVPGDRSRSTSLYHYTIGEADLELVDPDENLIPVKAGKEWDSQGVNGLIQKHEAYLLKLILSLMNL